jgi:formylglycine-generating enzyme required for sulfatase activity
MAPEQFSGESVDARSDVYALAVVGYEMLAGTPPFTGPSPQAVLTAHLTTPPAPVHLLRPEVPQALSSALSRALAKEPDARYASAAEFGDALAAGNVTAATGEAALAPGRRWRRGWAIPSLGLAGLALIVMLVVRAGAARKQDAELLARLRPAADSGRLDEVAEILASTGDGRAEKLLGQLTSPVAGHLSIVSDPAGATVSVTRVTPFESYAERSPTMLGTSPVAARPLVAGEYLVHLEIAERQSLEFLAMLAPGDTVAVRPVLLPNDSISAGMVLVGAGNAPGGPPVDAFLMDRYEVSNAQYLRFVGAGGYRDTTLWPDTLIRGDRAQSRDEALRLFVDKTGLPGPRGWLNGRPPDGRSEHPVAGVTWYEATAYARWAGKELPTAHQWWRAALGDGPGPYPWGGDASSTEIRTNFGLAGTAPVGSHPLGVSPWGVHDLPGNVREWLRDARAGDPRRVAVGGSWQDPSYMFEQSKAEYFEPGFASDLIGIRLVRPLAQPPR